MAKENGAGDKMNARVENPFLTEALALARRGWPVFPCSPAAGKGGKRPLVPGESAPGAKDGGFHLATTDKDQIRAWWRRWPKALIGVPTGARVGAFVVDLDPRVDAAGAMLSDLERFCGGDFGSIDGETGEILMPAIAETQSGGLHLWFALPVEEIGNRSGLFVNAAKDIDGFADAFPAIATHVDIRGTGGYVIVPPSVMANGNAYRWLAPPGERLAGAPARLLDVILKRGEFAAAAASPHPRPLPLAGRGDSAASADEALRKYALTALDAELRTVEQAGPGTRNETLHKAAVRLGTLVGAGALSEATVRAGLETAASGLAHDDGWPAVRKTIDSGLSFGVAHPRDLSDVATRAGRGGARAPEPPPAWPDEGYGGQSDPALESRFRGNDEDNDDLCDAPQPRVPEPDVDETIVAACAALDASDTDNAERFIRHFGRDYLVVAAEGTAGGMRAVWSGRHWDIANGTAMALTLASRLGNRIMMEAEFLLYTPREEGTVTAAREMFPSASFDDLERMLESSELDKPSERVAKAALAAAAAIDKRRAKRRAFGVTCKNAGRIKSCLELVDPRRRRPPDDFNGRIWRVATETHTLVFDPRHDIPDGEPRMRAIEGHDRDDLITALVPLPWAGHDAPAPKWRAFIDQMIVQPSKRRSLQQFAGLGLVGVAVQYLMFHYGAGANGKSVFLEVIVRVLGEALAVGLPRESIVGAAERGAGSASPDIIRLYGKRMVRILEVKKDAPLQEDLVKRLTGGEKFPARDLFKGFMEFQNRATAHMSGNGFPTIDGADYGTARRLLVMHWDQTIPEERRRDFEEVVSEFVAEEGPGILAWLVDGLMDYLDNGGLYIAAEVRNDTEAYRVSQDPIGEFFDKCVKPDAEGRVGADEFYRAFCVWGEANAKFNKPPSMKRFGLAASGRYEKREIAGRNYYFGILVHVPVVDDAPQPPSGPDDYL